MFPWFLFFRWELPNMNMKVFCLALILLCVFLCGGETVGAQKTHPVAQEHSGQILSNGNKVSSVQTGELSPLTPMLLVVDLVNTK